MLRERVEAMKAIWTQDEASYHGKYVNFDRIWSWPKPAQWPHPPILVGGTGPTVLDRVLAFGDAWFPNYHPEIVRPDRRAARPRRPADRGPGDERAGRPQGLRAAPRRRRAPGRAAGCRPARGARSSRRWRSGRRRSPSTTRSDTRRGTGRFAAARVARLATADAGGRPHLVPVTFAVAGDMVYSAVDAKPKRAHGAAPARQRRGQPAGRAARRPLRRRLDALWWVRADGTGRVLDPADPEAVRAAALLADRYPRFAAARRGARRRRRPLVRLGGDMSWWRGCCPSPRSRRCAAGAAPSGASIRRTSCRCRWPRWTSTSPRRSQAALREAVERSDTGYPAPGPALADALAGFAGERWGWEIDPGAVTPVDRRRRRRRRTAAGAGPAGDPVVVCPPVYPPFFGWVPEAGGRVHEVPLVRRAARPGRPGAGVRDPPGRVPALQPAQPGRPRCTPATSWPRWSGWRAAYGVPVVSDEIHAPLVLPGRDVHADPDRPRRGRGRGEPRVGEQGVEPGRAQVRHRGHRVAGDGRRGRPPPAGHPAGGSATSACWPASPRTPRAVPWLDRLLATLDDRRALLGRLLAERLPEVSWRPPEATFLAWLDCSAMGAGRRPARALLRQGPGRARARPGGSARPERRVIPLRLNFGDQRRDSGPRHAPRDGHAIPALSRPETWVTSRPGNRVARFVT